MTSTKQFYQLFIEEKDMSKHSFMHFKEVKYTFWVNKG